MTLYAFSGQQLTAHIDGTEKYAMSFADEQYCQIASQRIKISSSNEVTIPHNRLADMIRLVCILHDIGKADEQYQKQVFRNKENASFFLHEVPSAVIANRLIQSAREKISEPERFLVLFSIIQHHLAMRTYGRAEKMMDIISKNRRRGWEFEFNEEISQILSRTKFVHDKAKIGQLIEPVTPPETRDLVSWLYNIASSRNQPWTKLYVLVMNPLVVGDNTDAQKNRPAQQPSRFVRALMEVCKCQ